MPNHRISLEPEKFYHIYNRGFNGSPIFTGASHDEHFLRLYEKYISPVAQTYTWAMMDNHFHWLVQIKPLNLNPGGFENLRGLKDLKTYYGKMFLKEPIKTPD